MVIDMVSKYFLTNRSQWENGCQDQSFGHTIFKNGRLSVV